MVCVLDIFCEGFHAAVLFSLGHPVGFSCEVCYSGELSPRMGWSMFLTSFVRAFML